MADFLSTVLLLNWKHLNLHVGPISKLQEGMQGATPLTHGHSSKLHYCPLFKRGLWSEFLATDPEVSGSIPGAIRFSEK
jgi:hypothetical protein